MLRFKLKDRRFWCRYSEKILEYNDYIYYSYLPVWKYDSGYSSLANIKINHYKSTKKFNENL